MPDSPATRLTYAETRILTAIALAFVAVGGGISAHSFVLVDATPLAPGRVSHWFLAAPVFALLLWHALRSRRAEKTLRIGLAALCVAIGIIGMEVPAILPGEWPEVTRPIPLYRVIATASPALLVGIAAVVVGLFRTLRSGAAERSQPSGPGRLISALAIASAVAVHGLIVFFTCSKTSRSNGFAGGDFGLGILGMGAAAGALLLFLPPFRARAKRELHRWPIVVAALLLALGASCVFGGAPIGLPAWILLGLGAALVPACILDFLARWTNGLTAAVGGCALGLAVVLGAFELRAAAETWLWGGVYSALSRFGLLMFVGTVIWIAALVMSLAGSSGRPASPTIGVQLIPIGALLTGAIVFCVGTFASWAELLLRPGDPVNIKVFTGRLREAAHVLAIGGAVYAVHHLLELTATLLRRGRERPLRSR